MQSISVVVLYDQDGGCLLFRRRTSDPYYGLLDFVGGKCKGGENGMGCAYRVLQEKAGIEKEQIGLQHVMDFAYHTTQWCVQVFCGRLEAALPIAEGERLTWLDKEQDFFDEARFAGEGYIGHILAHMRMQLFAPGE